MIMQSVVAEEDKNEQGSTDDVTNYSVALHM